MLRLCQQLLALRKAEVGGQIAQYRELAVDGGLWAYQAGGLTVLANLSAGPVTWPGDLGEILITTGDGASSPEPRHYPGPLARPHRPLRRRAGRPPGRLGLIAGHPDGGRVVRSVAADRAARPVTARRAGGRT